MSTFIDMLQIFMIFFFSKVFATIPPLEDYALIIGGDFNCVLNTSFDRSSNKIVHSKYLWAI